MGREMLASTGYGGLARLLKGLAVLILLSGAARAEGVTILALGDSLTAGYGLAQEDGFVPQLETWINNQGIEVSIINAGVSGDTSAGGAARLGWILTDDVDIVLVALGANDMLRGIDPDATRANLDRILSELTTRGLPSVLIGIPGPSNFGQDYQGEFNQIFPDLSQKYRIPLVPNFLAGLTEHTQTTSDALQFLQPDGLHPTAEGVSLIVNTIGPSVLDALP